MNTNTITKYKWFWAWNDAKEEAWLLEMSQEGLHLKKVSLGSYEFVQGEPTNYVYRLDYRSLKSKEKESYLQIFKDAGWEHIGDMSGWVYFRINAEPGETPEIFSDAESKMGKYQRVIMYLVIFLPILLILRPVYPERYGVFSTVAGVLFTGLMILYSIAMVQLMRRMNEVKQKKS
jgi:hypothetical protein